MADRTPLILNTSEKRIEQVQSADTIYVPKDLKVYSGINCATVDDTNTLNTGYYARTDFLTGGILGQFFTNSATNSGAISVSTVDPASHNGCINYLTLSTQTSATSKPLVICDQNIYLNSSFAEYEFGARVCVSATATAGEDYSLAIGLTEENISTYSVASYNNIVFHYNRVSLGNNWIVYTATPLNNTSTDTGVAVSTSWQRIYWKLDRNNNAPRVRFYINDSLVATHTTNIPDSSSNTHFKIILLKTVGTTAREFRIDYNFFKITYLNRQTRF